MQNQNEIDCKYMTINTNMIEIDCKYMNINDKMKFIVNI